MIYHIAHLEDFNFSKIRGIYFPAQFPQDGFIHCSTKNQVITVANKYFLNSNHLILLEIDENKLTVEVKYENLEGGQDLYPHIYGEIPFSAISQYSYFNPQPSGFTFPTDWILETQ